MDYISNPITATFPAGINITTISIPLIEDSIVEETEMFTLAIMVPSSEEDVKRGTIDTCTCQIVDSNG